ncbi:unnamed protein product [Heligmosomoides polygyrus]|uniref:Uncharacterized protein n=1 Tax=Heligmosomoides polygyrus TaxID=6339 RepID=A0A183G2K3_HELPZ|nr:unnamed protein product [Heligmosomoides polygyrus]
MLKHGDDGMMDCKSPIHDNPMLCGRCRDRTARNGLEKGVRRKQDDIYYIRDDGGKSMMECPRHGTSVVQHALLSVVLRSGMNKVIHNFYSLFTRYLSECKTLSQWETSRTFLLCEKRDVCDIATFAPLPAARCLQAAHSSDPEQDRQNPR